MHTKVRHLMESVALLTPKLQVNGISQKPLVPQLQIKTFCAVRLLSRRRVPMSLIQGIRIMC